MEGAGAKLGGELALAAFDFPKGSLVPTEAGSKRRASLHVLRGEGALQAQDPGGLEPLSATCEEFEAVLRKQNHTLKRSLTDPRLFSGIGNAYSDEILHRAIVSARAFAETLSSRCRPALRGHAGGAFGMGPSAFARRRGTAFLKRSRRSERAWLCTADSESPARCAAPRCSGFAMPTTKPTTVRAARPRAGSWRTARCPGFSKMIGRDTLMNSEKGRIERDTNTCRSSLHSSPFLQRR